MKVFEVITEHCEGDSKEITKTVLYVTAERNSLMDVTDYFTRDCLEYEKDLIGVREVLTIVEHIEKPKCSFEEYMKMYDDEEIYDAGSGGMVARGQGRGKDDT